MKLSIARLRKVGNNFNRLPEVLRCRKHTPEWQRLTSAYVGLNGQLPFSITNPQFEFVEAGDVATFWQIFYREIYRVEATDRLIIDAGANIGAFSLYALKANPHVKVIAVEPAPDSCKRLRATLRANDVESRCTLAEVALGDREGETTIELDAGSQFRRSGVPGHRVPLVTLDSLIPAGAEVDFLKMDIEGAEYGVVKAISPDTLRRIRRIVLEFHPQEPAKTAIDPLTSNGFKVTCFQDDGEGYGLAWLVRA